MHQVFSVNELLQEILCNLENKQIAAILTVCKQFETTGADIIWSELRHPFKLFAIVPPTALTRQRWVGVPHPHGWERLLRYSRRLRKLTCDYYSRDEGPLFLDQFTNYRPMHINFFPNLLSLFCTWNVDKVDFNALFLVPSLTSLDLTIKIDYDRDACLNKLGFENYLQRIATSLPALESLHLDLCAERSTQNLLEINTDISLQPIFDHCRHLVSLHLHDIFCTPNVVLAAAEHPGLHIFKMDTTHICSCRWGSRSSSSKATQWRDFETSKTIIASGKLPTEPFTALQALQCTIPELSTFASFEKLYPFDRVSSLSIATVQISPQDLGAITRTCRSLKCLSIAVHKAASCNSGFSFQMLQPLFLGEFSTRLQSLTFKHNYPLQLSLTNMEQIATSLPSIRHLILNDQPESWRQVKDKFSHPGLRALIPFARNCPMLRTLKVFLMMDLEHSADIFVDVPRLLCLQELEVGPCGLASWDGSKGLDASYIASTAACLNRLCHPSCSISSSVNDLGSKISQSLMKELARLRSDDVWEVDRLKRENAQLRQRLAALDA